MLTADTPLMHLLQSSAVAVLCRRMGVARLEVFGSAGTAQYEPGRSDVDLIVQFVPAVGLVSLGQRFIGLAEGLESLLGAPVDLMTEHPISNPYLRHAVDASRQVIYDAAATQASV